MEENGYQSCDARSTKTAKHIVPELLRTEYHLTSYIQVVRDRINNRLPGIDLRGVRILDWGLKGVRYGEGIITRSGIDLEKG